MSDKIYGHIYLNVFIEKYDTVKDGADSVNGDSSPIVKCCKGKQKSAYGFKWIYEEDYQAN